MDHLEHLDVLIVGAGISGIGAAYYLQQHHPDRQYAIVEARGATGGTWDLFRYPGIRSDSDLHTFGYEFKPWRDDHAIATADKILAYLRETAAENGIDDKVRFHHKVLGAEWNSAQGRWIVDIERTDTAELLQISANWLFCAGGYYRYDEGYTPHFEGRERFTGRIVHPQHWPEDLDYTGKKVVIIGSGATAVTLVPAMADKAGHVTMLQRSPTYVLPVPSKDRFANIAKTVLGDKRGYALARRKNIAKQRFVYQFCQQHLAAARRLAGRPVARLVDLGSGAGHVVIYAAALAPNVTAEGHELAAGRHRAAVRARAALPSSIALRCAFVEGDMLRADLSGADIVFASTLALGEELRSQLAEKLAKEVLPGAVVFSSTRLLGGPGDRPHVVAPMSWSPGHEVAAHVAGAGTFAAV